MWITVVNYDYTYNNESFKVSALKVGKPYLVVDDNREDYFIEVVDRAKSVRVPKNRCEEVKPPTNRLEHPPEIVRPDSEHYHTGGIDVWKFAKANFSYEALFGFHQINIIKYLTRFGKKNGRNIKDLEKAKATIEELIKMEKEREGE